MTIAGRALGPEGQPNIDGFILTRIRIEPFNPFWRAVYQIPVRDGRFELHGLPTEATTRIHLLDPEHEWGASVDVSGKLATSGLTIRLEPCGKATARARRARRPAARKAVSPTSGSSSLRGPTFPRTRNEKEQSELAADAGYMPGVDRAHYWHAICSPMLRAASPCPA